MYGSQFFVIKGKKKVFGKISDILLFISAGWRDVSVSGLIDSSWQAGRVLVLHRRE